MTDSHDKNYKYFSQFMKTKNILIFIFVLGSMNCSYGQTSQITYSTPIDSIRIDSTLLGYEKYSISIDSIGTDGLFYKGMGKYIDMDNSTQNYTWFESSEYDIDKKKKKYQLWQETNDTRKYSLNESFTYDERGRRTFYSNSTNVNTQNVSWTYNEFDSLTSQTALVFDLASSSITGNKYECEYYLNHRLSNKTSSIFNAGSWSNISEESYFYGSNGIADTVLTIKSGIPYCLKLIYKNTMGRDSFIVFQTRNQSTNTWVVNYSDQYMYDTTGKLVQQNRWDGLPTNSDPNFEQTWVYNHYGQLLKNQTLYYGGAGNQTNYTYYGNGRPATYYYGFWGSMGDGFSEKHNYYYKPIDLPLLNSFDFLIYPNPASDNIEILANFSQKMEHQILLTNLLGQSLIDQTIEIPAGSNRIQIRLNSISKGTYLIRIDDGTQSLVKKLIVIK